MSFPKYPKYKPSGVEWLGERQGASPRFFCPWQVGKPSFMSQPRTEAPAASAVPLTEARP